MYDPLAFLLVGLWTLSPLGAQSILRIISIKNHADQTLVSVFYLNTSADVVISLMESVPVAKSPYLGALIASKFT